MLGKHTDQFDNFNLSLMDIYNPNSVCSSGTKTYLYNDEYRPDECDGGVLAELHLQHRRSTNHEPVVEEELVHLKIVLLL